MTRSVRNERGQAFLLAVGFMLIAFAIAGVAVDGARLWILRRGLQNSADAATLAAAARLETGALYESGGASTPLDRTAASRAAREMLARRGSPPGSRSMSRRIWFAPL